MRITAVILAALGAIAVGTSPVMAQKMEPSKGWEVGDKATYTWSLYAKKERVEEEVIAVTDTEVTMVERMGDKTFDRLYDKLQKRLVKSACLNSMVQCTFTPGNNWADWPLEKGKRWSNPTQFAGPTFEGDLTKEHVVEAYEKVKVPAGEFDAYKISFTGRIKGRDNHGKSFDATEKGSYWYALISGKPVMVKFVYSNSFSDKVTKELITVDYR